MPEKLALSGPGRRVVNAAVAAAVALVLGAAPAGATVICPAGLSNPISCTDPGPTAPTPTGSAPTAVTRSATEVKSESATLDGVAGPSITNGDATTYFFQWGTTTSYGRRTPPGRVGSCPTGEPGINHCSSPATQEVSYPLRDLKPCTTYHYRVVAEDSDGSATGGDRTFTPGFLAPISSVSAPRSVKPSRRPGRHFMVAVELRTAAKLSVLLRRTIQRGSHGRRRFDTETVAAYDYSSGQTTGKVRATFQEPGVPGSYRIVVTARLSCGTQIVTRS